MRVDGHWAEGTPKTSNGVELVTLRRELNNVFVAHGRNSVGVIDSGTNQLAARIELRRDQIRAIAISQDQTRGYATNGCITLAENENCRGVISVFDTTTFLEIDTLPDDPNDPNSLGNNPIKLPPGAVPFQIAAHPNGDLIFVTDLVSPGITPDGEPIGIVHVIDVQPQSPTYHQVGVFYVTPAPVGLRGLDFSADGKRLYIAAPARERHYVPPNAPGNGSIIVVDVDPSSETFLNQQWVITEGINKEPFSVTATSDPNLIAFANLHDDFQGVGLLKVTNAAATEWQVGAIPLSLGPNTDTFDVNNASDVAVTSDLKYAFVTGINRFDTKLPSQNPFVDPLRPAGSNVGIIRDPFFLFDDQALPGGDGLVAATRPIPLGGAESLVLSPDDSKLYVAYRSKPRAVFVYDVNAIIEEVNKPENQILHQVSFGDPLLTRGPVNDLVDGEFRPNADIDLRADYRVIDLVNGNAIFGVPNHNPPDVINPHAPIVTVNDLVREWPQGLVYPAPLRLKIDSYPLRLIEDEPKLVVDDNNDLVPDPNFIATTVRTQIDAINGEVYGSRGIFEFVLNKQARVSLYIDGDAVSGEPAQDVSAIADCQHQSIGEFRDVLLSAGNLPFHPPRRWET